MSEAHPRPRDPVEEPAARRDRAREKPHVVAERLAESPRLEEVALHVDHHQRGPREFDLECGRALWEDGYAVKVVPVRIKEGRVLLEIGKRRVEE